MQRAAWTIYRDVLTTTFAVAGGAFEIAIGGGRPSVLTFLSGLLLSPIFARIDMRRQEARENGEQ